MKPCVLLLLLLLLLLAGCKIPAGDILSCTQSFIGIRIGQNPQTQMPQIDIGFVRTTYQIVPTSTNAIYAPPVNSSLSLDQKAFTTAIDENFLTGDAEPIPESPAVTGAKGRKR